MEKTKEVLELEKIYGIELKEAAEKDFSWEGRNTYVLNSNGEITHLNLSENQISEIKGLEALVNLESLYLSRNQISEIKGLETLGNLQKLWLSRNQISEIIGLETLGNLQTLDLSGNQLNDIKGLETLGNLQKLYLENNQISEIKGLETLGNLQTLWLHSNKISEIKGLETLGNLQTLSLNDNQISEIKGLETLGNLQWLYLSENQIREIKGLKTLGNLQSLNLYWNKISEIKGLEKLENLQSLNLSENQIREIKGLETLGNLQKLSLSENQISEIKGLETLGNLQELNLFNNKISVIKGLETLGNLQGLYLQHNQISVIKGLETLGNLQGLYLQHNQITDIKALENLVNLQKLNLSSNQISEIKGLETLGNLETLDLSDNQISEIKGLETLGNLQTLYLRSNQISEIKGLETIIKKENFIELRIDYNPFLENISLSLKVGENHKDALLKYFSDLKQKKVRVSSPAKVMLLGNHGAGKTTFREYFKTGKLSKPNSTHILNIEFYNYDEKEAIIYDFGGQDYYHGLYQAFFSEDSINLIFWRDKTNANDAGDTNDKTNNLTRNYTVDYWLCQLDYAFNKRKAENKKWREKHQIKEPDTKTTEPVLLVQTHTDEDGKQNSNQGSRKYVEEFHVALNETAVKNNVYKLGLELLKETLLQYISAKNIGKVEDKYFDEFQKYLLAKAENSIYSPENISIESNVFKQYKQFRKDYSENKKITENDETLFEFMQSDLERLYQKGLVLYYKSNEQLENVVWLNPTETVKHIHDEVFPKEKNKNILIKKHGIVSKTDFNKLCKDNKIKELLMSEKVIFLDEHENKYIVPGYLQLSDEDKLFKHLSLEYMEPAFILKFQKFIPFGLINQLICLYGNFPNEKLYWRDQLFFWFNNHRVWIKLDFPQLSIAVYINSFNKKQETNIPLKQTEIEHCIFFNIIDLYYGNEIPLKYPDTESPKEKQTDDGESKRLLSFTEQVKEYIRYKEGMKFPDDMYLSVDGEHFISHEKLQSAEANQKTIPAYTLEKTNQKTKKGETIEVIGTVTSKTEPVSKYLQFSNNKNIKDMKKIFISYSREDVGFKNMLKKHLNMLSVVGSIADNWSCEEIGIDKWDKKIQEKLDESDLVIYMLSVDFFSSPYILEKEVQNVIEGKKGEKKILCVIVREFIGLDKIADYTDRIGSMINVSDKQKTILALKDFQYLPYGMDWNSITKQDRERITPLKEYSNKGEIDKALTQITTKILELFNKEF